MSSDSHMKHIFASMVTFSYTVKPATKHWNRRRGNWLIKFVAVFVVVISIVTILDLTLEGYILQRIYGEKYFRTYLEKHG